MVLHGFMSDVRLCIALENCYLCLQVLWNFIGMTWCLNLIFLRQIIVYSNAFLAHISNYFKNQLYIENPCHCRFWNLMTCTWKNEPVGQRGDLTYLPFMKQSSFANVSFENTSTVLKQLYL
jgi:hypothetical protein